MFVLSVAVTNQCKRPILYMPSATCSLLLPMYALERVEENKRTREANKYFYSIFCSHIRIPTLCLRLLSLTHSENEQASNFLNCTIYFFPALSPFSLSFSSHQVFVYKYLIAFIHFLLQILLSLLTSKNFSYQVK
jgi:hypothetical protein